MFFKNLEQIRKIKNINDRLIFCSFHFDEIIGTINNFHQENSTYFSFIIDQIVQIIKIIFFAIVLVILYFSLVLLLD